MKDIPILYKPIDHSAERPRRLHIAIDDERYDKLLRGELMEDKRPFSPFYIDKCTYTYSGKMFIKPFDSICYHVGHWKDKVAITARVTDITCDGHFFTFHLGEIIR